METDMPNIIDLVAQLEESGVTITGREKVLALESSADWTDGFIDLVAQGKQCGVEFVRTSADAPSDVALARILNGYPFGFAQREIILHNVLIKTTVEARDLDDSGKVLPFTILSRKP
jgi:hypothetical protein